MFKSKTCKIEGCTNPVWSGGMCRNHISPSKGLKKTYSKSKQGDDEMRTFFMTVWNSRPHKSEISGDYLGSEPLSTFFHHILPKSKYSELALEKENIILLTAEEHESVELNPYKYEKINWLREKLKIKFNIT